MLKDIIRSYNETKLSFVNKISDSKDGISDELSFLDDGFIKSKIDNLKKEYGSIEKEIEMLIKYDKKDDYNTQKIHSLMNRRRDIKFEIAFLASNNIRNIDGCLKLLEEENTDFKLCLLAIQYYSNGEEKESFDTFYKYFKDKNVVLEHYLINKIYGKMCFALKQYDMALVLLRKAAEKRPEDPELHCILKEIYHLQGRDLEESIESSIIKLLGGSRYGNDCF